MLHEAKSAAEKDKWDSRQDIEEQLALFITPTQDDYLASPMYVSLELIVEQRVFDVKPTKL